VSITSQAHPLKNWPCPKQSPGIGAAAAFKNASAVALPGADMRASVL